MTMPATLDYDDLIRCAKGELFGMENGKLPMPPMLMLDRVALITGASDKGIGGAIARRLHGLGGELVLTGRRTDALQALAILRHWTTSSF